MQVFNTALNYINDAVIAILTIGFLPQILYVLLFFLKAQKYPIAEIKHKFGIVIPARNESAVIAELIESIKQQNYPSSEIQIFVIADNCTDNTAEIARSLGATVIERFDEQHKIKSYALNYGFKHICENHKDIEVFLIFDADNIVHPDCISKYNDAFDAGVELARGYANSKNLTDNVISGVSGLYYIRDSRYSCHVRSALHTDQNLPGSGMMIKADIIRKNGWDTFGLVEDAEFTFKRMLEGYKTRYVSEAIYYEEQPTTLKDTFARNIRMGKGLNKLFFSKGFPMLGKFFTTFRYGYLDMFLTLLFIPIALLCCFWFPLFYGYKITLAAINFSTNPNELLLILKMAGIALLFLFYGIYDYIYARHNSWNPEKKNRMEGCKSP
jgi:cellulose synthase/poly-beta-1,6-N-acetylglucosamine synthase-like glycosyltransferase